MSYFATPPLAIVDAPADARHITPGVLRPQMIILHATVGSLQSSLDWLTTNAGSVVSVHRLIAKDGTIYKLVDDRQIANHVGNSALWGRKNLNPVALGIELVNTNTGRESYPVVQLEACAAQVAEWIGAFGYLPIFSHAQVDTGGKTDPAGFPFPQFYAILNRTLAQVQA